VRLALLALILIALLFSIYHAITLRDMRIMFVAVMELRDLLSMVKINLVFMGEQTTFVLRLKI